MTAKPPEVPFDGRRNPAAADSAQKGNENSPGQVDGSKAIFPEAALILVAKAIRELRKVRREQFGLDLAEPAWDMIVELYFKDCTGASTTASQLQEVSNVPRSTAERWLRFLQQEGWVEFRSHPSDPSTRFAELTEKTREAMDRYLSEVRSFALKQPTG